MRVYDILRLNESLLHALEVMDINVTDLKHLPLYSDYLAMMAAGEKVIYIEEVLAERYNLCVRAVRYIIKRMKREVELPEGSSGAQNPQCP